MLETLSFSGSLLRPGVAGPLRSKQNLAHSVEDESQVGFLETVCKVEMSIEPLYKGLHLGREEEEERGRGEMELSCGLAFWGREDGIK